jgi:hypothetical protein
MPKTTNYTDSLRFDPTSDLCRLAKAFAGRKELNGYWTDEGNFVGTRAAVTRLADFRNGYKTCNAVKADRSRFETMKDHDLLTAFNTAFPGQGIPITINGWRAEAINMLVARN